MCVCEVERIEVGPAPPGVSRWRGRALAPGLTHSHPPPLSSLFLFHRRPTRTARPPSSCAASPTRNGIARACAATASSRPLSRRAAGAVRATTPRREQRGEGGRLFFLFREVFVCAARRAPPLCPPFVRLLLSAASGRRGTSESGRRCVLLCCCCSGPKRKWRGGRETPPQPAVSVASLAFLFWRVPRTHQAARRVPSRTHARGPGSPY